jgi:transcriptional regulator with XRE-family HTH domain
MSAAAIGAYFRTLRKLRDMSIQQIAELTGTSVSQVSRIETGEQETRGSLLFAFARAVKANLDDMARLLLDTQATTEDGEALAREWLGREGEQKVRAFFTALTDAELEAIIVAIVEIRNDPLKMAKLQGFLDSLRDPDVTVSPPQRSQD